MSHRLRALSISFAVGSVPFIVVSGITVLGLGAWRTVGIELLFLPLAVALVAGVISLSVALVSRFRKRALGIAAPCLGLVLGGAFGMIAGQELRIVAFELAAARSAPLIAAIKAYEQQHGVPPQSLSELIPTHLPELPARLPPLKLVSNATAMSVYEGNKWALTADVSGGILNWDSFVYLPNQDYAAVGEGVERVGDWAYVHE